MPVSLTQTLRPLYSPARTSLLVMQGVSRYDHTPLRAGYIGSRVNLTYLRDLFFATSMLEELGSFRHPTLLGARTHRTLPAVDLLLTDVPRLWQSVLGVKTDLVLPAWVRQEVHINLDAPPGQRLLPRATEREIERHIRRERYSMDICADAATLAGFFHQFYVPYVTARFGGQAVVVSESRFLQISRRQQLARLFADGRWVAGMLIHEFRNQLKFGWYGATGDTAPPGAAEVLDGLCLRNARSRGISKVVMGNSRPSLQDGVVRYKAKFGARIVPTPFPQTLLGIRLCNASNGALVQHLNDLHLIANHAGHCHVCELPSGEGPHRRAGQVKLRSLTPMTRPRA